MSFALQQLSTADGAKKKDTEQLLMAIAEQLEQLDAIIKNRTDHEVWKLFHKQQQEMKTVEKKIGNLLQYGIE